MKPTIRKATLEDLPILLQFEQGIITAERPYDETLRKGHINYYDIQALIESKQAEVIVAEIDGEVVSSAYAKRKKSLPYLDHEYHAYLGFMFVKPSFRGQGINRLIIDRLYDWAKANDLREIRLEVYDGNDAAIRAYEKAGFKKNLIMMRTRI
ncbi:MAG: GNAT family N-acetyltransferase [Saprospiraceae bacterium]